MAHLDPWTLWIPGYHRMRFDYALHEGPNGTSNGRWVVWLRVSELVVLDARWTGTEDPAMMAWVGSLPGQWVSVTSEGDGAALMGWSLVPHHQALPGCPMPTHVPDPLPTTPEQ